MKKHRIHAAFDLLQQPLTDREIVDRLLGAACSRLEAEKLVAFVPTACGRVLLSEMGVSFPDTYTGMREDGSVGEPQRLSSDPDWNAIQRFVTAQKAANLGAIRLVGTRSAEFDAANKAIQKGSSPADLVGSGPVFLFIEPSPQSQYPRTPWWAFWRRQ